jgi:hypothetical protein
VAIKKTAMVITLLEINTSFVQSDIVSISDFEFSNDIMKRQLIRSRGKATRVKFGKWPDRCTQKGNSAIECYYVAEGISIVSCPPSTKTSSPHPKETSFLV